MSIWSRITNAFRGDRLNREIDEEFAAHIEEAIAAGDDPAEVRRSFGSQLRLREQSRDARIVAWLDYLRADLFFGWRQLLKRKITTAAAILSLALAIMGLSQRKSPFALWCSSLRRCLLQPSSTFPIGRLAFLQTGSCSWIR
jgi:hypothetical protein